MATRVTSARLIGRMAELAELEAALADAAAGRPSLAFVAGESGVGKTRLVAELEARAREDQGARVIGGDCVELGEGELPYAPLVAALRPLARAGDPVLTALPAAARAELSALLPGQDGEVPSPSALGEGGAAQSGVFEALLMLLEALGRDHPVLLVLEDIHWADRSTRAFLAFLSRSVCSERVLVVATYRPDELHRRHPLRRLLAEVERDARSRRIELHPLSREELGHQLEDILGAAPESGLVERMWSRSEGNPLFAEELLAAGLDGRGALPPTLRDALMVRVERLPDRVQELLRLLAAGGRMDHALLAETSGLDARELRDALREAAASHILTAGEGGTYAFRHALLREVVADDLLPGEQAELHLSLARALERRAGAGGPGAHLAAGIAHHYTAAGDQPAALAASVRAAAAAERVHAYGEAAALLERALELWERVPDAEALAGSDRIDLLTRAAHAQDLNGDPLRQEALLRRALDEVDETARPHRAAALLERLSRAQWGLNLQEESLATTRRGLGLLPDDDVSCERAALLSARAKSYVLRSRFQEAAEAARVAIDVARAAGDEVNEGRSLNCLGSALMVMGQVQEGAAVLRRALAIAQRHGGMHDQGSVYINLSDGLHLTGRTREALEVVREGHAALAAAGARHLAWSALAISELSFALGEWQEAAAHLQSAARRELGTTLMNAGLRRGELALGLGDHETARTELERIAPLVAESTEPQFHGPLGALMAELERRGGDLDAARVAVDDALDRIEFCSEDVSRLARVSAVGVTVEADAAQRARDLGDPDAERVARSRAQELTERVRAAGDAEGERPLEHAWLATALADLARASGEADPQLWAAAASAWAALEHPYPTALARWREAEAHLARDEREEAAAVAGDALAIARRLGAGWLAGEIEGLAARARLALGDDTPGDAIAGAQPPEDPFGLTPRERQVLTLVARGATNREIGAELYMAEKTASVHVSRILAKLDVRSRTQAADVAHRLGLAA